MTDTDDTDDLLLIPPDFFAVKSDPEHSEAIDPYHSIIDSLIRQVGKLQNRLKSIESSDSFFSNSLEYATDKPNKMRGFRKYNSSDDLYLPQSTQGTPPKTDSKLQLNSLPNTPYTAKNVREYKSPVRHCISPKTNSITEKDGRVLNEIDTFLSRVKTIQRINAVRNLDKEFGLGDVTADKGNSSNSVVDGLKPKVDLKQNKVEVNEPVMSKERTWRLGDTKGSVPDLGVGFRDTLYKYNDGDNISVKFQPDQFSTQSSLANDSLTSLDRYSASDGSSDSTQITAFQDYNKHKNSLLNNPIHSNALNVLNMHKQLLEDSAKKIPSRSKIRDHKLKSTNTIASDDLGLVNLADIWNQNSELNSVRAAQKLQEEKLRRQHCESLIKELQNRNLELQQKLSVAVKVDDSKNKVIGQFQDALEKIISKTQVIQKEKRDWENEFSKNRAKHKGEMEEAMQKIAYYDKELSKALSLVHGNQEKVSLLEKRYNELESEMQSMTTNYKECQDLLGREVEKNKQLSEILSEKEIEISENKNTLSTARSEVAKSRKAVEICQEEFNKLKNECNSLRNDLQDERSHILVLEEQKRELFKECEDFRKREEELQIQINKIEKQLESSKLELRNFYQGQVEILVQNKLKEFQAQLDQAEASFKEELKKRELTIAKTAALHIQQISEKYSLEIKLIEKKHQEETKLYQIQIMQYKQQIDGLHSKLEQFQEKRVEIAKQLQKIMETQWSEALRIIASGKSPNEVNEDSFSTIDQLNSLRTRSYNNVEELLVQSEQNIIRNQKDRPSELFIAENENDPDILDNIEAPISSKAQGQKPYNEHDIQKYINLLLNKPHGNTEGPSRGPDKNLESERGSWTYEQADDAFRMGSKSQMKDRRYQKPPWK